MKPLKSNNMKKIFYIILTLLIISPVALFLQCDSEDDLVTKNAKDGGLIDILTPSLNYVVGSTNAYTFSMFVYQGEIKTKKIYFYRSFFNSADTLTSNEVLDATMDITGDVQQTVVSNPYLYADLIKDLTVNDVPVPANDAELSIGDKFIFRIVAELSDGRVVEQSVKVNLTVSTRYAGTYKTVDALYFRLGVLTYTAADWPAEITIESVDAITYKMVEYVGPFDGNTLFFQIDADGNINYPLEWDGVAQVINAVGIITCLDNPLDMTNVNCGNSNYVINDDVNGKDRLVMSIGYYTSGSGPREFYQVLEKIVE
jgi:hypothetical protein